MIKKIKKLMKRLREKIIRKLGGVPHTMTPLPELKINTTKPAVKLSTEEVVFIDCLPEGPEKRARCEEYCKKRLAANLAEMMIDQRLVYGEKRIDNIGIPRMKLRATVWVLPPEGWR